MAALRLTLVGSVVEASRVPMLGLGLDVVRTYEKGKTHEDPWGLVLGSTRAGGTGQAFVRVDEIALNQMVRW